MKTNLFICNVKHNFCLIFSDLVAQRGERLELLIDKTENLVDSVSMEYYNFLRCKIK